MVVCTVQKILPLILLGRLHCAYRLIWIITANAAIGLTGRLRSLRVKGLLVYSSVFNGA